MMYGPGLLSLRGTAAVAADGEVVSLSDKGVLGRLRKMGDWLEHLLQRLLEDRCGLASGDALRLSLVDGSVICAPGATGTDWRLHARFDPGRGRFGDLVLTAGDGGERVDRTRIEPGTIVLQDRGYARVRDFRAVLVAGADFITRTGWRAVPMTDPQGLPINVISLLRDNHVAAEHLVHAKGIETPLRLIVQRLPDGNAETQIKRLRRRASKQGNVLDARTVAAASHVILLTSLPSKRPARRSGRSAIDRLPALDPDLARTWLLALIAAVLTDEIASEITSATPEERETRLPQAVEVRTHPSTLSCLEHADVSSVAKTAKARRGGRYNVEPRGAAPNPARRWAPGPPVLRQRLSLRIGGDIGISSGPGPVRYRADDH